MARKASGNRACTTTTKGRTFIFVIGISAPFPDCCDRDDDGSARSKHEGMLIAPFAHCAAVLYRMPDAEIPQGADAPRGFVFVGHAAKVFPHSGNYKGLGRALFRPGVPGSSRTRTECEEGEMADFREVVKDLVWQFACHSNDHSGKWLSTGGLLALANIMKRLAVPLRSYS